MQRVRFLQVWRQWDIGQEAELFGAIAETLQHRGIVEYLPSEPETAMVDPASERAVVPHGKARKPQQRG